jgi:hypothetical protein
MPDSIISEVDFAYAAGLIDGEGHIAATSHKTKSRGRSISTKGKPYIHRDSRISMSLTTKEPLDWLLEKFGGTVYFRPMAKKKWKNQWTWVALGNESKEVLLKGIIPHLKIKQRQAALLLEYVQLNRFGSMERRDEIISLCKELNRKGKPVETNTPDPSEKWTAKIESELTGDCKKTDQVTDLYGVGHPWETGDLLNEATPCVLISEHHGWK